MIVDFTVSNYRSIKEPVTLSFIAQKGRPSKGDKNATTPSDDSISPGYEVKGRDFKLLPVAAVFGANASGKSNVLRALDTLTSCMVFKSEGRDSFPSGLTAFRLEKQSSKLPTSFQLRFAEDGAIFTFETEIQEGIVLKEQLEYSPSPNQRQSTRLLYRRIFNSKEDKYEVAWGDTFVGPHTQLLPTVEKQEFYFPLLNRLRVHIVEGFFSWLMRSLVSIFCEHEQICSNSAAEWFFKSSQSKSKALQILQKFDTSIHDLNIRRGEKDESHQIQVVHQVNGALIHWDFEEESLGTQRLFVLLHFILTALEFKSAIIVDEFGANFHPKITREIIKLFHSPETNPHGAQLIFTSHDNTLWRGVLRRDEIWLTEKKADQSTQLVPLSAYKPRTDLAMDKAYLDGRFGGVPLIGDISEVFEKVTEDKGVEAKELADVA